MNRSLLPYLPRAKALNPDDASIAQTVYSALHLRAVDARTPGDTSAFALPPVYKLPGLIRSLPWQGVAFLHHGGSEMAIDPSDPFGYVLFEDLSFFAFIGDDSFDTAFPPSQTDHEFDFARLFSVDASLTFLYASVPLLKTFGDFENWRRGAGTSVHDRQDISPLLDSMQKAVFDHLDPLVSAYDLSSDCSWSDERKKELESEIVAIMPALLTPGQPLEVNIHSATGEGGKATLSIFDYDPAPVEYGALLSLLEHLLNLDRLHAYNLEYSGTGDRDRLSSYSKSEVCVVAVPLSDEEFSAHQVLEAATYLSSRLVETGMTPTAAEDLIARARNKEPAPS